MSWTQPVSEFYVKTRDTDQQLLQNPRITNLDGFQGDMKDTYRDIAVTEEYTDESDYPAKTYKHIIGFNTYEPLNAEIELIHRENLSTKETIEILQELQDRLTSDDTYHIGGNFNVERFGIEYDGLDGEWRHDISVNTRNRSTSICQTENTDSIELGR